MQKPAFATLLLIVGIFIALISALADVLRLGRHPGFGWIQGLGLLVGVLVILAGFYLRRREKKASP